jgi:thiamine kinase-like enzyme
MLLLLSSQNVIEYLQKAGLCSELAIVSSSSKLLESSQKNLNLLVNLADNRQVLVKQKTNHHLDQSQENFFNEWLFYQLLEKFTGLGNIPAIASLLIHYDAENSILVSSYLSEYVELGKFYRQQSIFPQEVAIAIGTNLAELHSATFHGCEYRDFMATPPQGQFRYHFYNPAQGVSSISPEIFGLVPMESLKFHVLYQRYESLESAIADLAYAWKPSCLTHNDLQLDNILVHSRWQQLDNCLVRLIDWEACTWGDPAFDLGTLLASYLRIWLGSLIVDPALELEESLHLAMIPLEIIQPSLIALIRTYLDTFPRILESRPDFIIRVIQFAGLRLIHQIQEIIEYRQYFDNSNLCMLQVAENLLTMPEQAILTILGISAAEILQPITNLPTITQPAREQQLARIYSQKKHLRGC